MKKLLIVGCAMLLVYGLTGQKNIQEGRYAMSEGSQNGFLMQFEGMKASDVESIWNNYIKNFKAKSKKVKKSDEWMSDDAEIKGVSENTIDLYTLASQKDEAVSFFVWFNLGGAYLSSKDHPNSYPSAAEFLAQFANEVAAEQMGITLKAQEDALKTLEKALADQQKEQQKEEEAIQKAQEAIKASEQKIEELKAAQKDTEKQIQEQMKQVEETKGEIKRLKKM